MLRRKSEDSGRQDAVQGKRAVFVVSGAAVCVCCLTLHPADKSEGYHVRQYEPSGEEDGVCGAWAAGYPCHGNREGAGGSELV